MTFHLSTSSVRVCVLYIFAIKPQHFPPPPPPYTHTQTHTCTDAHMHTHLRVCVCACMCAQQSLCICTCMHLYMCVCVCVCVLYGREEGEGWRGRGLRFDDKFVQVSIVCFDVGCLSLIMKCTQARLRKGALRPHYYYVCKLLYSVRFVCVLCLLSHPGHKQAKQANINMLNITGLQLR